MAHNFCTLIMVSSVFISNIYGNAILQETSRNGFPPYSFGTVNNTVPSFSQRLVNLTETGIEKIKSSVTTLINNVSNVFNRTAGSQDDVLGSACSTVGNCSVVNEAVCDRGMCNCGPNFTAANNMPDRCLRVVKLGEACEEDIQCSKGTVGSVCIGSRCACSEDYTEDQSRCIPKIKLGAPCKVKDDCAQIPFADCYNESICACPKPLLASVHRNVCLIMASPAGDPPCQEDIQCEATYGDRSHCIDSICTCDYNYHPYNGKCLLDRKIGEVCQQSYDCIVSKKKEDPNLRQCSNGTCVCVSGYGSTVEDDHCISGTAYGYQLHASVIWLLMVFFLPYLF